MTKLHYYYDKEADIFYLSSGKPSSRDKSVEKPNDIVLRFDRKTRKVKGFTVLNFSKRAKQKRAVIQIPIHVQFSPAS
ncbi:MAG: DUF2283 domain-containing protein [Candidatus Doudnabacteria bacterium]|nr:DUF2283 domain-containing protein [Candidatus Doudnabacteria bacterium]